VTQRPPLFCHQRSLCVCAHHTHCALCTPHPSTAVQRQCSRTLDRADSPHCAQARRVNSRSAQHKRKLLTPADTSARACGCTVLHRCCCGKVRRVRGEKRERERARARRFGSEETDSDMPRRENTHHTHAPVCVAGLISPVTLKLSDTLTLSDGRCRMSEKRRPAS